MMKLTLDNCGQVFHRMIDMGYTVETHLHNHTLDCDVSKDGATYGFHLHFISSGIIIVPVQASIDKDSFGDRPRLDSFYEEDGIIRMPYDTKMNDYVDNLVCVNLMDDYFKNATMIHWRESSEHMIKVLNGYINTSGKLQEICTKRTFKGFIDMLITCYDE